MAFHRGARAGALLDGGEHVFLEYRGVLGTEALQVAAGVKTVFDAARAVGHGHDQLRLHHPAAVAHRARDHRHVQRHDSQAALSDARPRELARFLDVAREQRLVDDQVVEQEIAVEAHFFGGGAQLVRAQLHRQLAKGDVAGPGERLLEGNCAVALAVGVGQAVFVVDLVGALAVEGALGDAGDVLQRAGERHDLEYGARGVASLRGAVEQHAVVHLEVLELFGVFGVVLGAGIEREHLAGLIVDDRDRAVVLVGEHVRDVGLQIGVDGERDVAAFALLLEDLRRAVEYVGIEAQQVGGEEGLRAGRHLGIGVADYVGDGPARVAGGRVDAAAIGVAGDEHGSVAIEQVACDHRLFGGVQAGVIGGGEPAAAVGIDGVEEIAAQRREHRQHHAQHGTCVLFELLHGCHASLRRARRHWLSSCSPTAMDTPCRIPSISIQLSMDEPP